LDEAKRQDLWNLKFHSPPLIVEPSIRIPSMFIDPVVDVFVDPCEPTVRQPSRREKEKFHQWTQRYSNLIFIPLSHWGKTQLFIQKLPRIRCLKNVNFVKHGILKM